MQEAGLQKGVALAGIGTSRAPAVAGGGRQGTPGRGEFGRREVEKARAKMEEVGKDKVGMGKEKAAEVGKSAVARVVIAGGRL